MGTWNPGPGPTSGDDLFVADASVEAVDGGAGNDTFTGGGQLTGTDSFAGGAGDDVFNIARVGGVDLITPTDHGNIIDGGAGYDTVSYAGSSVSMTADTRLAVGVFDGLSDIEAIIGSNFGDTLRGFAYMDGGAGADSVTTASDSAQAFGGAGNDHLSAFSGVGATLDGGEGDDFLSADVSADLIGGAGNDTLSSSIDVSATMAGGAGDDVYSVNGADSVITENADSGIDTVSTSLASFTLGANLENLSFHISGPGSPTAFHGIGNALANQITGLNGNDLLEGGAGDDTLKGGDGNDLLQGDFGNDVLKGEGGDDELIDDTFDGGIINMDGGAGWDLATIAFDSETDGVVFNGGGTITIGGLAAGSVVNFEYFSIHGGLGSDSFVGGVGNDLLLGDAGDDTLVGSDGNDEISGDAGDDVLIGGAGNDTLSGGDDDDRLIISEGGPADFNADIYDGGAGIDVLEVRGTVDLRGSTIGLSGLEGMAFGEGGASLSIDEDIFQALGATLSIAGSSGVDSLYIELKASGAVDVSGLSFDSDWVGAGSGGAPGDSLSIVGTGGADTIIGSVQNDTISGQGGADSINGGGGDDVLEAGGVDPNTFEFIQAGTGVTLDGGAGDDLALLDYSDRTGSILFVARASSGVSTASIGGIAQATLTNVENFHLDLGAGADIIIGGAGRDFFGNVGGADAVDGGAGSDEASLDYTLETRALKFVLAAPGATTSTFLNGVAASSFANIETFSIFSGGGADLITTGAGADVISGGAGADTLSAGVGADTLAGGLGADVLNGGAGDDALDFGFVAGLNGGADSLSGGAGNDTYGVDDAGDLILEAANAGLDSVYASVNYMLASNVENLTLLSGSLAVTGAGNGLANNLLGNNLNNLLSGGAGNDTLDGGSGADTLNGGSGADVFYVDDAGDRIVEAMSEGVDSVRASVNFEIAANVENLILIGNGLSGTGNALANAMTGDVGANLLSGLGGDDTLDGAGNAVLGAGDTLVGGLGNDVYIVSSENDVLVENVNEGADSVRARVNWVLGENFESLTLLATFGNLTGAGNSLANVITGNEGNNTLSGGAGNDTLDGGQGADSMEGGDGADTFYVDQSGDVVTDSGLNPTEFDSVNSSAATFTLGANIERLTLLGVKAIAGAGNNLANVITGNIAANALSGDAGADTLIGGAGDDTLDGGAGTDSLVGGAGNDRYIIDDAGDVIGEAVGAGVDSIVSSIAFDLSLNGVNVERLTLTGSTAINGVGNALNNVLIGNDGNNSFSGAAGADSISGGLGDDTLLGGDGNDSLEGGAGADSLTGGVGDDTLDGGADADVMTGGTGNDVYIVDSFADSIIETSAVATEIDAVRASVTFTAVANIENVILTGVDAINATGNSLKNTLAGNIAANELRGEAGDDSLNGGGGADMLDGADGNDTLDGGEGADSMFGGLGADVYVVDDIADSVNDNGAVSGEIDVVKSSVTWTLDVVGQALRVENLILQSGAGAIDGTGNGLSNAILGNESANILAGGDGADTLQGGGGNDSLDGGAGADSMAGGLGDDAYAVDAAADMIVEAAGLAAGIDSVTSSVTYALSANVENLTLSGLAAINGTGNASNNVITGNGAINILNGGAGADTLDGGLGADQLFGGAGNDLYRVDDIGDVVIEFLNEGSADTVRSSVSFTLGGNIENLVLLGTFGNLAGAGNGLNNLITGNEGDNTLSGGAGNDTLDGGAGADSLEGGVGADVYYVDDVGDVVTDAGLIATDIDTVNASVSFTLGANIERLILVGVNDIDGTGNNLSNTIIGNGGVNVLDGGVGADSLNGAAGTDTLVGGLGNDTLDGGSGADRLEGGDGADSYYVDDAGDVVFDAGLIVTEIDTVFASVSFALSDRVERLTLLGGADISGTGGAEDNLITGNSGNNQLGGGLGDDTLLGGGGADSLDGGLGADSLAGGMGNDAYIVDNSGDIVVEGVGAGLDGVSSSVSYTLTANVENLVLTGAALQGSGNALNNNLTGNSLNNILSGGDGDDVLDGGAGADTLIGGMGNDSFYIDDSGDVIVEVAAAGADVIYSSVDFDLGAKAANVEGLTLLGVSDLIGVGNALSNFLTGNSGANSLSGGLGADLLNGGLGNDTLDGGAGNDTLDGGVGADSLIGGAGADTYIVNDVGDVVSEAGAAIGEVDNVRSTVSWTLGASGQTLIENLRLLDGAGDISGTGNDLANMLTGNDGANALSGGLGADTLVGGLGADTLDGGLGADSMDGGGGDDFYVVDDAGDLVVEIGAALSEIDTVSASISFTLSANLEHLTLLGSADINGVGNARANLIIGNSGANILVGGAGADTISGGLGADVLYGGLNADRLTGGDGGDAFVFNTAIAADNVDQISDFNSAEDVIWLDNAIFTLIGANGALAANQFHIGSVAEMSTQHILYDADTGGLYYDANGSAAGGVAQIALLTAGLSLASDDFLII